MKKKRGFGVWIVIGIVVVLGWWGYDAYKGYYDELRAADEAIDFNASPSPTPTVVEPTEEATASPTPKPTAQVAATGDVKAYFAAKERNDNIASLAKKYGEAMLVNLQAGSFGKPQNVTASGEALTKGYTGIGGIQAVYDKDVRTSTGTDVMAYVEVFWNADGKVDKAKSYNAMMLSSKSDPTYAVAFVKGDDNVWQTYYYQVNGGVTTNAQHFDNPRAGVWSRTDANTSVDWTAEMSVATWQSFEYNILPGQLEIYSAEWLGAGWDKQ